MSALSVIVATAGLLLNSPAVVESMGIDPQAGSALASSVDVAIEDGPLVRQGVVEQVVCLGLAIVIATVPIFSSLWYESDAISTASGWASLSR